MKFLVTLPPSVPIQTALNRLKAKDDAAVSDELAEALDKIGL